FARAVLASNRRLVREVRRNDMAASERHHALAAETDERPIISVRLPRTKLLPITLSNRSQHHKSVPPAASGRVCLLFKVDRLIVFRLPPRSPQVRAAFCR